MRHKARGFWQKLYLVKVFRTKIRLKPRRQRLEQSFFNCTKVSLLKVVAYLKLRRRTMRKNLTQQKVKLVQNLLRSMFPKSM